MEFKANHVQHIGSASVNGLGLKPEEVSNSMIKFFDLWFYDKEPKIKEENTFEITINLLTKTPSICSFQENCQKSFFAIEYDGAITTCDPMKYVSKDIVYGNILNEPFEDIMNSVTRQEFLQRHIIIKDECNNCSYSVICNGGCQLDSIIEYGNPFHKASMCSGYKKVYKYIDDAIQKSGIADSFQKQKREIINHSL